MNRFEENYILDEDFTGGDNEYYLLFKTPDGENKKVENLNRLRLRRITDDSVELTINHSNPNRTLIYHYVNDFIELLDYLDIGFR